jgi:hypothetical protein
MRCHTAARCAMLIAAFWILGRPAAAQQQHHPAGHPAAGGAHPGGQMHPGGMQVPPHMQQQMQRQMQQAQQQQQRQMQQMQKQAQQQYQKQVQQFESFLKSKGQAGASSKLPKDPAAFDNWATTQKTRKAQGKSYDPLYDHFRSFADEAGGNQGQGKAHAQGKDSQSGREAKEAEAHHRREAEAREGAEAERRAAARAANARNQNKLPLAQDQTKIAMLRNVHTNLQQADHDYDGQRVHAMHAVRQAIQHLGASAPAGNVGSGAGSLAQGQSDQLLRQSLQHLRNVESQLAASGSGAAHHTQARASIGQAIHHLESALRVN